MKKLRILILFDTDADPPAGQDYSRQIESADEAEFDVARALRGLGHEVRLFGFRNDLDMLVAGLRGEPVDAVFNLTERFRNKSGLDYGVAALMDMLDLPYTGASAEGLMLARNKALTKMVLAYQGLRIPHFFVCPRGQPVQRPSDVRFPLIVKPLDEDASVGIAQRSVVRDDPALAERVAFIHARHNTSAIVEEFIAGRELYVGVISNDPPRALPPIEMVFGAESAEEAQGRQLDGLRHGLQASGVGGRSAGSAGAGLMVSSLGSGEPAIGRRGSMSSVILLSSQNFQKA